MTPEALDDGKSSLGEAAADSGVPLPPGSHRLRDATSSATSDTDSSDIGIDDDGVVPTFMGQRWRMRNGSRWSGFHDAPDSEWTSWAYSAQDGGKLVRA